MRIKPIIGISFILWSFLWSITLYSLMLMSCDKDPTPPDDDPMPPADDDPMPPADSIIWHFEALLAGEFEVPPVNTPTTGNLKIRINEDSTSFMYMLTINNAIESISLGAYLHCASAGQNGPIVIFLNGATPLGFDGSFELKASRNTSKIINISCGDSILEFIKFLKSGNVYVNVHNDVWPSGEIRGQVVPVSVYPPR